MEGTINWQYMLDTISEKIPIEKATKEVEKLRKEIAGGDMQDGS